MLKNSQRFSLKVLPKGLFYPLIFYLIVQELFVLLLTPKKLSRRKSAEFFCFIKFNIKKPAKRDFFADKLTKLA